MYVMCVKRIHSTFVLVANCPHIRRCVCVCVCVRACVCVHVCVCMLHESFRHTYKMVHVYTFAIISPPKVERSPSFPSWRYHQFKEEAIQVRVYSIYIQYVHYTTVSTVCMYIRMYMCSILYYVQYVNSTACCPIIEYCTYVCTKHLYACSYVQYIACTYTSLHAQYMVYCTCKLMCSVLVYMLYEELFYSCSYSQYTRSIAV